MDTPFPAYVGDEPYVFVSYAHDDAPLVFPEMQRLRDAGFNVWYDDGIRPGSTWREEVALALTESKLFIYFVTDGSVNSENCHQELNFALSRERRILAVHLTGARLTGGIELSLSNKQAIIKPELSDGAYADKFIEAVRSLMPAAQPSAASPATNEAAAQHNSVAILPFNNRSSDPENEYLCDGIAEELITGLARVGGLRVASQLLSFGYKGQAQDITQIGRKLKVANVLTGSIQKSGQRVRITATLSQADTADVLWSERYDGTLEDVFELQEDVATKVVEALELQFSGAGDTAGDSPLIDVGTSSQLAYQHYLAGRFEFGKNTRQSTMLAHEHYDKAIAADPQFGRACWYAFVNCCVRRDQGFVSQEHAYREGNQLLERLRQTDFVTPSPPWHLNRWLDPELRADLTPRDQARELVDALSKGEDLHGFEYIQIGFLLCGAGLLNSARQYWDVYQTRFPSFAEHSNIASTYGNLLFALGRFEQAIEHFSATYAQQPSRVLDLGTRAMLYSRTGQYHKAAADLTELAKTFPRNFAQFYDLYWRRELDAADAYFQWMEGQRNLLPLFKLWGCFLLGHIDRGVDHLEQGGWNAFGLRVMALYALTPSIIREVTAQPRYQALLEAQGVGDAWRLELMDTLNGVESITGIHVALDEDY